MLWPSSIQACTDHGLVVSEAMPHADVGHPSEARPTSVFGQRSHPQAGLLSNSVAASLSSNSLLAYFSIGEKLSMAGENPGVPYRVICSVSHLTSAICKSPVLTMQDFSWLMLLGVTILRGD